MPAPSLSKPVKPAKPTGWKSRNVAPYFFIAPFFLLFLVFGLFPLIFSIFLSLHQWDAAAGMSAMHWVGLQNYQYALTDPWFQQSLYNTLWFALVSGLPQHLVALPLAYFINLRLKRSRNLIVGAYFIPYITSSVAIALIFTTLLSTDYGVINALLAELTRMPLLGTLVPVEPVDCSAASDDGGMTCPGCEAV